MSKPDADVVRDVLSDLLLAVGGPTRLKVKAAVEAFGRLHPAPPGANVLVMHTWCTTCGHQHDTYTATDSPVRACVWLYCKCPGFAPRSLAPPTDAEVAELRAANERQWEAYKASKKHARR
jgi:hypothetical protein